MKNSFVINDDYANSRLDRWFKKRICNVPQSLIEKSLRKGNIKVNNKKTRGSYQLQKDDRITIFNINFSERKNTKANKKYVATRKELVATSKFFVEDNENFVVLNKPSGISVQSGTKTRKNIIDILSRTKQFKDSSPFCVHRIDKETTGILIVAKNREYAKLFTTLFRIRKIHKIYLAIVIGTFSEKKGTFKDNLFYYEGKKKIFTKAITYYEVLDSNNNYSLLKLSPVTGRKHQIRQQLKLRGHPILGDVKYRIDDKKLNKKNNMMLHSYKIKFSIGEKKYNFKAQPSNLFAKTLKEKYLKIFSQ